MPIQFDESPLDQAHFLRVIARALPSDYLAQLQARPDSGYELFEAIAATAARVAGSVHNVLVGSYALHAEGGAKAGGVVSILRPDNTAGDFTLMAGSVVATADGRAFRVLQDASFVGATLQVDVLAEAVADGWEWNVRGERSTAAGLIMPALVQLVVRSITEPAYVEPRLVAYNSDDMTGGRGPMLDAVANDRGIARGGIETDDSLSYRARTLPDTVSPGAVLRLLHALLDSYGIPFGLVETFEHSYQEAWDAPSQNPGTPTYQATSPTNPNFDDATFVYDDPRAPDLTFRNRWLDEREFRAAFIVVIDRNFTLRDLGIAYDDPGTQPLDFHPALGRPSRQTPAYDASSSMPPELVYGAAYDGFDIDQRVLIASLWNTLQQIRAGGVAAIIDYVRP